MLITIKTKLAIALSGVLFCAVAFADELFITVFDNQDNHEIMGLMDKNGNVVLPTKYDNIRQSDEVVNDNFDKKWVGIYKKDDEYFVDFYDLNGRFLVTKPDNIYHFDIRIYPFVIPYPDLSNPKLLAKIEELSKQLDESPESEYKARAIVNSYGVMINNRTKKSIPLTDKNIAEIARSQNDSQKKLGLIGAMDDTGKWGFIDENANWVIRPQFEDLYEDDKDFLLTPNILSIHQYRKIFDKDNDDSCQGFVFMDGSTAGEFKSFKGFEKHLKYGNIGFAEPCRPFASVHQNYNGIINDKGEWLIEPKQGRKLLSLPDDKGFVAFTKDVINDDFNDPALDKIGFMDIQGNIKIPPHFYLPNSKEMSFDRNNAKAEFSDDLIAVSESKDSPYYGFIDRQGEWAIKPTLITHNANSYYFDDNGFSYTYLPNNENQTKMYNKLKSNFSLSEQLLPNSISGRRVIDKTGQELFKELVGDFYNFNDKGYAVFASHKNHDLQGVINKKGHFVIPPQYETIELAENFVIATLSKQTENDTDKKGLLSYDNQVILPFEYTQIYYYDFVSVENAIFVVQHQNGNYGVLDKQGNWLIPLQNNKLGVFDEGVWFKTIGFN
ncbi:MAG: WG repeat-containing protein [Moraxella sp.]|uniref:WG repeat-containing protein n=1 Tax=Moraxella sp. TaxID=479 RepID=UPI0026DB81F1|nr:WG repeat-containing protein [Moraxella sp.]MDO4451126.1 WG repeat-containing protein [Moraxella sp.]